MHTGLIIIPIGVVSSRVQVVDRARAGAAQVVVVERQRLILSREHYISLGCIGIGQVAGVVGTAVDVGIGGSHVVGIVGRALTANEAAAVHEHQIVFAQGCGAPTITHIDGHQTGTSIEHLEHVGHIGGVETVQVQTRYFCTGIEHSCHIFHLIGVEVAHINARQFAAVTEHANHRGHLAGIQIIHARDGLKAIHAIKPCAGGRRAGIGERGVKDGLRHLLISVIIYPTGRNNALVQVVYPA